MTELLQGINADDPTCFARLGVCPNDHIYAENAMKGLQASVYGGSCIAGIDSSFLVQIYYVHSARENVDNTVRYMAHFIQQWKYKYINI